MSQPSGTWADRSEAAAMGGVRLTQSSGQDEARSSIQALAQRQGARLKAASSIGMIAALVAAACMPVAWPLLGGVPAAAQAAVALLGATGGSYISGALKDGIEPLPRKDGAPVTRAEPQEALQREVPSLLPAQSEPSAR